MLARVPIISAYDPSRESMLAYASPSYETAIVITGLVNDCLGQFRTLILIPHSLFIIFSNIF